MYSDFQKLKLNVIGRKHGSATFRGVFGLPNTFLLYGLSLQITNLKDKFHISHARILIRNNVFHRYMNFHGRNTAIKISTDLVRSLCWWYYLQLCLHRKNVWFHQTRTTPPHLSIIPDSNVRSHWEDFQLLLWAYQLLLQLLLLL